MNYLLSIIFNWETIIILGTVRAQLSLNKIIASSMIVYSNYESLSKAKIPTSN
jgi:hypothetical protein